MSIEAPEGSAFRCLFCCFAFVELPFHGCCGGCYTDSAAVRAAVDEATPQTRPWPLFVEEAA